MGKAGLTAVIGHKAAQLCSYLEENKIKTLALEAGAVPSLTGLLLERGEISDMVLTGGAEGYWSMGHILAAAKQLQGRGRLVLLGDYDGLPPLLSAAADREALAALLARPAASGDSGCGSAARIRREPEREILPLDIPPGKILFLGVAGSQPRVGCTTQAIGLWHYCKALGFDPAVVLRRETLARLAAPMDGQEIPGGYRIEGIPFVVDTALAYDCYILDWGCGDLGEIRRRADCLVLVAGSKPWEVADTASALRSAGSGELVVLLSFSTREEGDALLPLFGRRPVAVLPWMPRIWQPNPAAMAIYDALLRPVLERALAREAPFQEALLEEKE